MRGGLEIAPPPVGRGLTIYHVNIKKMAETLKPTKNKTISSPRNNIIEAFTTKKENKELLFEVYKWPSTYISVQTKPFLK